MQQVRFALAEAQWSSWHASTTSPVLIRDLTTAANHLEEAARTLDGRVVQKPTVEEFLVLGGGLAGIVAATVLAPRSDLPMTLALAYVAYTAVGLVIRRAGKRRQRRRAVALSYAETTSMADRVSRVVEEIDSVLANLEPELGPKRSKADPQIRRARDAMTAASTQL